MEKITKYLAEECSEQERLEVEEWKNASPDNLRKFERYQKTWDMAKNTDCLLKPNVEKAWQQMKICIDSKKKKKTNISQWLAIAAVFMGIITMSYFFFVPSQAIESEFIVVSTGIEKQMHPIILSDGTEVWLNKNSELKYPIHYAKDKRVVSLKGDAFFQVAKNPSKPFQILLENESKVQVLGTSFNIKQEEKTEVDVFTGKVAFGKKEQIYLTKGMKGVFDNVTETLKTEEFDENSLAWKTGILVFKKVVLHEIVKSLGEYHNKSLSLTDKELLNKEFSVSFDNQSLDEAIEILELIIEKEHIIKTNK